ncbi:MAG: alkaline phosphatase family protein [Coriobacteriia bacterium]|nr:alkaline phosphatase family protein [Coriobacteriia bacterium]
MKRWALLVLGVACSLATAYGAMQLATYSWNQVVEYKSPFVDLDTERFTGARPPLSSPVPDAEQRRTVVVLIDGLTDEASRSMRSLEELRKRGADVHLAAPQPSLSYPCWTTAFSGATPQISGVTTNWYEGRVKVETLFDVAHDSGRRLAVAGPDDLDALYGVSELTSATALIPWGEGEYRSARIVDAAISLERKNASDFAVVLLPDVDDAGHAAGSASARYASTVAKVDADLARLIDAFDDGKTVFAVFPDHGHTPEGGHGGWEDPVVHTFAVFAGPGVRHTEASARLEDVAPTVSVLAGLQSPRLARGMAIEDVLADGNGRARDADFVRASGFALAYARQVGGPESIAGIDTLGSRADVERVIARAEQQRLASDRRERIPQALALAFAALGVLAVIGLASWRALVAAASGVVAYNAVFNSLYFLVHRYRWSLSTFNEESQVQAFFNARMAEAVLAAFVACVVAALVYAALRTQPKGPRQGHAAGWLALGVATVLAIQAVLGLQVAWFLWRWGASCVWRLPDLFWGFKYDVDLLQTTALGAAAILGPVVTYAVGRWHPKTRAES